MNRSAALSYYGKRRKIFIFDRNPPVMHITFRLLILFIFLMPPGIHVHAQTVFDHIDPALRSLPEYPLAKPLAGGPLRILFMGEAGLAGAACQGIVSRLECEYESILTLSREDFSPVATTLKGDSAKVYDPVMQAVDLLGNTYDVIWLDFIPEKLPAKVRDRLFERVGSGSGLVYAGPVRDLKRYTDGEKNDVRGNPGIYGKLRAEYAGSSNRGRVFSVPELSKDAGIMETGNWWSLLTGTCILASGREMGIAVRGVKTPKKAVEHESMSIMNFRVEFRNEGRETVRQVRSFFRNSHGVKIAESNDSYHLKSGNGYFTVQYPILPVGDYSVDVVMLDDNKTFAVSGTSFSVFSNDGIAGMDINRRFAEKGEFFSGRVRMMKEVREGMALNLDLFDSWGHRVSSTELVPDPRRLGVDFVFGIRKAPLGIMTIRANLYKNNMLSDMKEEPLWPSGSYDRKRFSIAVLDTLPFAMRDLPVYEKLSASGVDYFALEMSRLKASEAQTISAAVSKNGAFTLPVLDLLSIGNEKKTGQRTLAAARSLLDTLALMDVHSFIVTNGFLPSGATRPSSVFGLISSRPDSMVRWSMLTPNPADGFQAIVPIDGHQSKGITGIVLDSYDRTRFSIIKAAPWQSIFAGMNSVWWVGVCNGGYAAFAPGYVQNPFFSAFLDEARSISGGIDRLVYGSRCVTDPASILFGKPVPMFKGTMAASGNSGSKADILALFEVVDSSGKTISSVQSVTFKDGENYYVGVIANPASRRGDIPDSIVLRAKGLDGEYHTYDIRKKAYRSGMKEVSFSLEPGEAGFFSFLPYKVRGVELKLENPVMYPGNTVACQAGLDIQDGKTAGRHVFVVEIFGPDGIKRAWLSDIIETWDGTGKISIPISTVDTPGKWTLRVRDAASGRQSEKVFIVMPPAGG